MNFGTLLLLLMVWTACGAAGMVLLRRKGYEFDPGDSSGPWKRGHGSDFIDFAANQEADYTSQLGGLFLPAVGGVILLLIALVLQRKPRHNE